MPLPGGQTVTSDRRLQDFLTDQLLASDQTALKKFLCSLNKDYVVDLLVDTLRERQASRDRRIPVSVYLCKGLSPFQATVKFLREEWRLSNKGTSQILHKSQQSVWSTYRAARRKRQRSLRAEPSGHDLPLTIFLPELTVFESIVLFLKEERGLRFSEIARLIGRDQRSIWQTYRRLRRP
jgi:hypothetical protein